MTGRKNWKGQDDSKKKEQCKRYRNVGRTQWKKKKKEKKRIIIQANTIRWGQNNINHIFCRLKET